MAILLDNRKKPDHQGLSLLLTWRILEFLGDAVDVRDCFTRVMNFPLSGVPSGPQMRWLELYDYFSSAMNAPLEHFISLAMAFPPKATRE